MGTRKPTCWVEWRKLLQDNAYAMGFVAESWIGLRSLNAPELFRSGSAHCAWRRYQRMQRIRRRMAENEADESAMQAIGEQVLREVMGGLL